MQDGILRRFSEWRHNRDEKFLQNWPTGGRRHPWQFILMRGILMWAVPMIVGTGLFIYLVLEPRESLALEMLLVVVPLFLSGGLVLGWVQWWACQYAFRKLSGLY